MKYLTASISRIGPREHQEDAAGLWRTRAGIMAAVADGLGGMGGGERASALAMESLAAFAATDEALASSSEAVGQTEIHGSYLPALLQLIHEDILREQKTSVRLARMATTLSAGVFANAVLTIAHCGDSRIGIVRAGPGEYRGEWLTTDHSETQRLFDEGMLTEAEFADYPKNIIEEALGFSAGPPRVDAFALDVKPGDRFVFTTDGLHEVVDIDDLARLCAEHSDPQAMVDAAVALVEERGAIDNYTLAAVYAV